MKPAKKSNYCVTHSPRQYSASTLGNDVEPTRRGLEQASRGDVVEEDADTRIVFALTWFLVLRIPSSWAAIPLCVSLCSVRSIPYAFLSS